MKILRKGQPVGLGTILREVHRHAGPMHGERTALYVVSLDDARGLALAQAAHRASRAGPDPATLRERGAEMGAVEPLLAGAVSVETLARALESLVGETSGSRSRETSGSRSRETSGDRPLADSPGTELLGWTVREIHRSGGVPVVMLTDGIVLVTTLDALADDDEGPSSAAWARPVVGKA
jgi:hypothetical protein